MDNFNFQDHINAQNSRRDSAEQKAELEKLRKEQGKISQVLTEQQRQQKREQQLQAELFQIQNTLNNDHPLLHSDPNLEQTFSEALTFLNKASHYCVVTDQKNYQLLEYKELANQVRSSLKLIEQQAISVQLLHTLVDISNDYNLISTQPTEEIALSIARKHIIEKPYSQKTHSKKKNSKKSMVPRFANIHENFSRQDHLELASQARDYLTALTKHEWFNWAAQQLAAETEKKQRETEEDQRRAKLQAVADELNKDTARQSWSAEGPDWFKWVGFVFILIIILELSGIVNFGLFGSDGLFNSE